MLDQLHQCCINEAREQTLTVLLVERMNNDPHGKKPQIPMENKKEVKAERKKTQKPPLRAGRASFW